MSTRARFALIAALCAMCGCVSPSAHSTPSVPSNPAVQRFHDLLRRTDGHPRPLAPTQVLALAESLFAPPAVEIPFQIVESSPEGVRVTSSGTIWYSNGQLFVEQDPQSTPTDGDNYATIGDELVSWKPGSDRGVSFERFESDTATLLWYLIDASGIKSSIYLDYLQDPARFRRERTSDGEWLLFRDEVEGFLGVEVGASPLWLRSLRFQREGESTVFEMQFDRPRALAELPARVSTLAAGVTFDRVSHTIEGRMKYL